MEARVIIVAESHKAERLRKEPSLRPRRQELHQGAYRTGAEVQRDLGECARSERPEDSRRATGGRDCL